MEFMVKKIIVLIILISLCFGLWGADSTRTRAQLETIFTPTGSDYITAQDLRDFLASVKLASEEKVYRALLKFTYTAGHYYFEEVEIIDSVGITIDAQSVESGYIQFGGTGFTDSTTFCNVSMAFNDDGYFVPAIFYEIRVVNATKVVLYGFVYDVGLGFPQYEVRLNVEIIQY